MTTPTIEERVAQLEGTSRTHEAMLDLLISIGERQQETLDRQQEMLERHQALLERHQELLAEVRRDAQQTQRLWVRLAQRYGWLDENDDTDQG